MLSETRPVNDERIYRALLANTQDAVFLIGLDGRVMMANGRAEVMLGYSTGELHGLPVRQIVSTTEAGMQQQVIQRMLAGEVVPIYERIMRRKNGDEFRAEVNLSLVRDDDDSPLCLLALVRDISEREERQRALTDSQRLFAGVADMVPGIIHILDVVENRTVYVNRELGGLLGYPSDVPAGVLDRLYTTLIHPDDHAQLAADFGRFHEAGDHEVIEGEYRVRDARGEWRWLYSRSSVFLRDENGVPRQIISVLIDVDDRKREAERRWAEQERMQLVNKIATATIAEMPDDEFKGYVVTILHERFPRLRVTVSSADEAGLIRVSHSAQPAGMESRVGQVGAAGTLPEYAAALRAFQMVQVDDTDTVTLEAGMDARALLLMPLRHGDQLIGVLSLQSPQPHAWDRYEIETLLECASYVSVALSSAEQRRVRQKAEAALRESERLYRTLIDHFPDGAVLLFDHDLRYRVAGGSALGGVALNRESLEGRRLADVFPPDIVEMLEPYYRSALAGKSSTFDTAWKGRFYTTHLLPVVDDQGEIIAGLSVIADVTERRTAEEDLQLSQERYRQVVEDQTDLICRFVAGGTLTFVNEAYCRYFGRRYDEVIGRSFMPHIHEEDRDRIERKLALMGPDMQVSKSTQRSFMADGSIRWQEWVNRVILDEDGNVVEYQGVGRDITEQLQAEEALAEKHHLLQTVIDSLPDFIYVKDLKSQMLLDNIPHARSVGRTPDEVVGKTDYDLFPPDLAEGYIHDDEQVMETGIPLINREEISISTDGQRMWAVTTKVPFRNSKGEIIGLIGQTHDISLHKQAEAELQRERDFTQAVIDTTASLMIVSDPEGRIITFNHACEQLTGYSAAEIVGRPFWDIFLLPEEYAGVRAAFAQLNSGSLINHNINHWRLRNGNKRLIEWTNTAIMDEDGTIKYMISSGIDITERRQLEAQSLELAVERERVRFLNDFVRNVSHDLRTPLSILNTSLYLMRKTSDPARQAERIDSMKEQVDRLTRLIEQLLTMSRLENPDEVEHSPVDLARLMRSLVRSFEKMATERSLMLDVKIDAETLEVSGDETHLTIAFSNLLENELQYARTRAGISVFERPGEAVIEFRDDGPGIPAGEIEHIFDRFYRVDKARSTDTGGTGLGLTIAKKIIDAHGGRIEVETTPGQGSLFRLSLPQIPSAPPSPPSPLPQGEG